LLKNSKNKIQEENHKKKDTKDYVNKPAEKEDLDGKVHDDYEYKEDKREEKKIILIQKIQ